MSAAWKAALEAQANEAEACAPSDMEIADSFLLSMAEAQCDDSFLIDPVLFRQLSERGLVGRLEKVVRDRKAPHVCGETNNVRTAVKSARSAK